ncbi:SH3 domain-containing protein [Leptospira sp. 2 VSF19]|uniref:SH3 domain-containing protein n=2 Tax=Leptospira soteropolitanensis TaxID=2950025 RepID=A0AAW5VLM5_9LEPT|nr:SH3 domain-containing protein [Leptospira soteropolitanensis]MCW7502446.1 SH3 domain-containing protein [Leptospira soteropolitanensis]MCW7524687.1 SH3 domain-containing protein [Leptospira soteropolitanensis]MCW7528557.1 SH3 domain-containing protein [Leptospira soteropolitanensis]MCW7532416.1 SH3 domain-containing protein [Leptospira soteropolitanensis]
MKNRIALLIILLFPLVLNSEKLIFGENSLSSGEMILELENSKAVYFLNGEGDGCDGFTASFSNSENIYNFFNVISNCKNKKLKDFKCITKIDEESIKFKEYLLCDNKLVLYNKEKKVNEGLNRKINGIEVITQGLKKGIVTSNLKMREKPSKDSKSFECFFSHLDDENLNNKEITFIPKNYTITIIAKTKAEDYIGGKKNFWFLISPSSDSYNGCLLKNSNQKEGWVFGEYIRFDNQGPAHNSD